MVRWGIRLGRCERDCKGKHGTLRPTTEVTYVARIPSVPNQSQCTNGIYPLQTAAVIAVILAVGANGAVPDATAVAVVINMVVAAAATVDMPAHARTHALFAKCSVAIRC